MKTSKIFLLTTLLASFLNAEITICAKENLDSIINIEEKTLDGGECKNKYSLNEMKKNGWQVQDAKITTKENKYSIVYILNKSNNQINTTTSNINEKDLEEKIIKKLEAKQVKKENKIKQEKSENLIELGKKIYVSKCQTCHGQKGEKAAYGTSKVLNTLSYEDMKFAINDYTSYDPKNPEDTYDNGNAIIMRPYAANITNYELQNIKNYLDSINK